MKHKLRTPAGILCDSVDPIGHSMGGLVISGAIAGAAAEGWARKRVRRVVTLGTPFRGANAAIQKLATGGGTLFGRDSKERERTMARVTPSCYQLLPSFKNAVVNEDGTEADIFIPETFQPSIPATISEFVAQSTANQRVACDKDKCRRIAGSIFSQLLNDAWKFRLLTDKVDPRMLRPDGAWLAIVGAGEKTNIRTGITKDQNHKNLFDFEVPGAFCPEGWDRKSLDTGDETVPLRSAAPPWPESWRNTVVVTTRDFAWLGEMGDRVLCGQLGLHSTLPLLDLAQRWIINFLRPEWLKDSKLGQHGKLWGRALPGFPTTSGNGVATVQERQSEWAKMLPGLRLIDQD